jgi:hypothetical protein
LWSGEISTARPFRRAALGPSAVCKHRGVTEHDALAADHRAQMPDGELVASRPHDQQASRPGARRLFGRDKKVAIVRAALDAAQAGSPSTTLVVGEAGIGKTRLADEAAVMARTRGMPSSGAKLTPCGASRWNPRPAQSACLARDRKAGSSGASRLSYQRLAPSTHSTSSSVISSGPSKKRSFRLM